MDTFFHVSSFGNNTDTVVQDCMQQLASCPQEANFGFIYVTDVLADSLADILHHCKIASGIHNWIGSLGIGVIVDGSEIYDLPAISLLLCQFDETQFNMLPPVTDTIELLSNARAPENSEACFAFLHADGYHEHTQDLILKTTEIIDNCFIAGGLTSSRTKQFHIANHVTSNSISGVLFSDKIPVLTNLTQGCTPVGKKHLITQADQNVAFTLDHKPALDVLYNDIGEVLARNIEKASSYIFAGLCATGNDMNDYTVRTFVGIDEDKKVFAINDYINVGEELLFCRRDGNSAAVDMKHMLENIKKRLTKKPRGGVYVSCLGRGREQFGNDSEEVRMIHNILGEFPLTGFFANGEIHHNRVYGYTGVLTLFL